MPGSFSLECLKGLSQKWDFELDDRAIVNSVFEEGGRVLQVGGVEELVCDQFFRTYDQWIPSEE
jgi:hypothetical protein